MTKLFYKIYELINAHSSVKKVLFFFVTTQVVYATMLLFSVPKIAQYSNGKEILDLLPTGYSADYVRELFEILGSSGREVYLFKQIPLDMIYPALFAITYSLLLALILRNIFPKENKIQYLSLVPILAGVFDYLENIGIIIMLSIYPSFIVWLANLTSIFTVLKSIITALVFFLLIVGVIIIIKKRAKSQ